jgi:hypothetical protein
MLLNDAHRTACNPLVPPGCTLSLYLRYMHSHVIMLQALLACLGLFYYCNAVLGVIVSLHCTTHRPSACAHAINSPKLTANSNSWCALHVHDGLNRSPALAWHSNADVAMGSITVRERRDGALALLDLRPLLNQPPRKLGGCYFFG